MTITTEAAKRLASWCGTRLPTIATALRSVAAERDALKADLLVARNGAVAASESAGRMMEERDAARQEIEELKADNARLLETIKTAIENICDADEFAAHNTLVTALGEEK
jgi:hypothetical protein